MNEQSLDLTVGTFLTLRFVCLGGCFFIHWESQYGRMALSQTAWFQTLLLATHLGKLTYLTSLSPSPHLQKNTLTHTHIFFLTKTVLTWMCVFLPPRKFSVLCGHQLGVLQSNLNSNTVYLELVQMLQVKGSVLQHWFRCSWKDLL